MKCKSIMKLLAVSGGSLAAMHAFAQSSVTLYGSIDAGIAYQNNLGKTGVVGGGHSAVTMSNSTLNATAWGLTGSEDLGGGNRAIFKLEEGFNFTNGSVISGNGMFTRAAYVGFTNPAYGSFMLGRQYASYFQIMLPYGPALYLSGNMGAHPGDIDGFDTDYRANNTLLYMSPSWNGLTVSASYSLGGQAGDFNAGSTLSAGARYTNGPFGIAAAFSRINNEAGLNSTSMNSGATAPLANNNLTNGFQSAAVQQRIALAGGWQFNNRFAISVALSNVQYIAGSGSGIGCGMGACPTFTGRENFNTAGVVLNWTPTPVWDLAAAYAFTRAASVSGVSGQSTGGASYSQFNFGEQYWLSKRTGLWALQGYQRASGHTLNTAGGVQLATAVLGDGPWNSGGPNELVINFGMVHKF